MKEFQRLFISVDFSEDIKDTLYSLAVELKSHSQKGYITKKENFHLTLAFIGETKRVEEVISAIDDASKINYLSSFLLNTKGAGRFRGRGKDIYWIGIEENEMLNRLNKQLVRELTKREFQMEEKAFKPHLTLGREIVLKDGYSFEDFARIVPDLSIKVERIHLMKSHRVNGNLMYTTIYSKELAKLS
jgi:2'-5' RNA ligase